MLPQPQDPYRLLTSRGAIVSAVIATSDGWRGCRRPPPYRRRVAAAARPHRDGRVFMLTRLLVTAFVVRWSSPSTRTADLRALSSPGTAGTSSDGPLRRDVLLRLIDRRTSVAHGRHLRGRHFGRIGGLIGLVAGYFGGWTDRS